MEKVIILICGIVIGYVIKSMTGKKEEERDSGYEQVKTSSLETLCKPFTVEEIRDYFISAVHHEVGHGVQVEEALSDIRAKSMKAIHGLGIDIKPLDPQGFIVTFFYNGNVVRGIVEKHQ